MINMDDIDRFELNEELLISKMQEDEDEFFDPDQIDENYADTNKENFQIVVIAKQPNTKPEQIQTIN